MMDSKQHSILREGTAYEGDQPVTYELECSCGEVFDHIAPKNAREQYLKHAVESLQEQLETYRVALERVAEIGSALPERDRPVQHDIAVDALASSPASEPRYDERMSELDVPAAEAGWSGASNTDKEPK